MGFGLTNPEPRSLKTFSLFDKKSLDGDHYSSGLVHTISLLSLDNEFAQIIDCKNLIKKI